MGAMIKMAKTRAVRLNKNMTYDDKKFKKDAGGNIIDGNKNNKVKYTPLCVFHENKPRRAFFRGAKTLIVFVEDAVHALTWDKLTKNLQLAWGKDEAREFVFKMEALAQVEAKPMTMWQFAVLILINIIGLVAVIYLNMRLGGLGL